MLELVPLALVIATVANAGTLYELSKRRKMDAELKSKREQEVEATLDHQRKMQLKDWQKRFELEHKNHQRAIELIKRKEKSAQQNQEYLRMLDNWPLKNMPSQIVQFKEGAGGQTPLTVLVAPPRWKNPRAGWDEDQIEPKIAQGLGQFLYRYFPFRSDSPRPVHLISGTWKENGLRRASGWRTPRPASTSGGRSSRRP